MVITGANGHGKSTLLEAVHMLSVAKSIRARTDSEVINHELVREGGHVQVLGIFNQGPSSVRAQFDMDVGASGESPNSRTNVLPKEWRINGVKLKAIEFVGRANVVLFEARDLDLVLGAGAGRRRYLNILIGQFDTEYLQAMIRLEHIRRSRNALLRGHYEGADLAEEMPYWNDRFCEESVKIVQTRRDVMTLLRERAVPLHAELGEGEDLALSYLPSLGSAGRDVDMSDFKSDEMRQLIFDALAASRGREEAMGRMVIGPHLDDFQIDIGGAPARQYASRGQARTAALALRLAEASLVAEFAGRNPVLAFDDVLSEMDARRRSMVLDLTSHYEQTLLTATDVSLIEGVGAGAAQRMVVDHGNVSKL